MCSRELLAIVFMMIRLGQAALGLVVICPIPTSPQWTDHVLRRLNEAKEVGLVSAQVSPSLQFAKIFVPAGVSQIDLTNSDPGDSLRELLGEPTPEAGWARRNDLCEEAAEWLHDTYERKPSAQLFCEAGLSEVGDAHLSKKPHIIVKGRPLLNARVGADVVQLAQILRWGRVLRFLGVVVPNLAPSIGGFVPVSDGLFVCDAYDGDSFVVVSLGA
jgi:hypothetical protein